MNLDGKNDVKLLKLIQTLNLLVVSGFVSFAFDWFGGNSSEKYVKVDNLIQQYVYIVYVGACVQRTHVHVHAKVVKKKYRT